MKVDGVLKEGSFQQFDSSSFCTKDMGTLRFSVLEVHKKENGMCLLLSDVEVEADNRSIHRWMR